MQETQETQIQFLGQEDPLEEEMATHSGILACESHGQGSLAGYGPWGHKQSDMTERLDMSTNTSWILRKGKLCNQ